MDRQMDKEEVVVHIYNGVLFSHKRRMKSCHLQQHGWPRGNYAKWNKSGKERYKYHMIILICGM